MRLKFKLEKHGFHCTLVLKTRVLTARVPTVTLGGHVDKLLPTYKRGQVMKRARNDLDFPSRILYRIYK